jgi:ATP synthase protein I
MPPNYVARDLKRAVRSRMSGQEGLRWPTKTGQAKPADPVPARGWRRKGSRQRNSLDAGPRWIGGDAPARSSSAAGFAQALRLSSEFIAGVLVGAGIGWLIDNLAGTSPWGLIVFLLLGFVAGVLNVLRSAGLVAEVGPKARNGDAGRPEKE